MDFVLSSKWYTHTSTGIVSKGIYISDNKEYFVKGNSELGYLEPYSEEIASEIGKLLALNMVEYWIDNKEKFPEIKVYGKCRHVSVCRRLPFNIAQFYDTIKQLNNNLNFNNVLDIYIKSGLSIEHLYKMLLFDAFIGNQDRHLNNFDVMLDENGDLINAPILDCGASILFNLQEHELKIYTENQIGPDKAKPFKETHDRQINYIKRYVDEIKIFPYYTKEDFFNKLYFNCEKVFSELSEKRVRAIKSYLENRYDKYVAPYMIDNKNTLMDFYWE